MKSNNSDFFQISLNHAAGENVERKSFLSRKGELQFFIIWEYGRFREKEILADIASHFEILECFDILWSPECAINSFCRLYSSKKRQGEWRAKERGVGRFLLVTVWDDNPVYELAEAFSGFEVANTNMLKLKKRYRSWSNIKTSNLVHSSTTCKETDRDLTLILGKNSADYLASLKGPWDGSFVKMEQDMLGAKGWNSLEEVFYVLNNTVNYVVMRNFEGLPGNFDPSIHKDIDLLTDEREKLLLFLNPPDVDPFNSRPQVKVNINGQWVLWDTRCVGDDYYCKQWEHDMLESKVLSPGNVYVMNEEHYFYSLVYHALVHKKSIAEDYFAKAEKLLKSLPSGTGTEIGVFSEIFDFYFALLDEYMKRKHYVFCRSVYRGANYNQVVVDTLQTAERLEKKFGLTQVKPIRIASRTGITGESLKDCRTYYQAWLNGRKIFIKHSGYAGTHKTEFGFCNQLNEINETNFPKALFYSDVEHYRCVGIDYLEGISLRDKIAGGDFSPSEKKNVILQLKEIAKNLMETGIVHRDIHSDNLLIMKNGQVKLIDFGWAVDHGRYEECRAVRKNPFLFNRIRFRLAGKYRSDDIFSIMKILEEIGCQESYQDTYREVEAYLSGCLGKKVIKYKYRHKMLFYKILREIKKIPTLLPKWKKRKKLAC